MVSFTRNTPGAARSGFTLIEILVVVVILGILAAVVVPQFTGASDDANDSSVRIQLKVIREQIELYRVKTLSEPKLKQKQWDDLVMNDYLHNPPVNPFNGSSVVSNNPGAGVGWVWKNSGNNGVKQIYATDETFLALYAE